MCVHAEEFSDHVVQVVAVLSWYPGELSLLNLLEETVHVVSAEWRHQCTHFVAYTAKGPHVALRVVGLVLPYLGTGVVWCSSLGVEQALLSDLGDVQVAEFGYFRAVGFRIEEYVGTF